MSLNHNARPLPRINPQLTRAVTVRGHGVQSPSSSLSPGSSLSPSSSTSNSTNWSRFSAASSSASPVTTPPPLSPFTHNRSISYQWTMSTLVNKVAAHIQVLQQSTRLLVPAGQQKLINKICEKALEEQHAIAIVQLIAEELSSDSESSHLAALDLWATLARVLPETFESQSSHVAAFMEGMDRLITSVETSPGVRDMIFRTLDDIVQRGAQCSHGITSLWMKALTGPERHESISDQPPSYEIAMSPVNSLQNESAILRSSPSMPNLRPRQPSSPLRAFDHLTANRAQTVRQRQLPPVEESIEETPCLRHTRSVQLPSQLTPEAAVTPNEQHSQQPLGQTTDSEVSRQEYESQRGLVITTHTSIPTPWRPVQSSDSTTELVYSVWPRSLACLARIARQRNSLSATMRLRDLKNDSIRLSAVNLLTTAAPHLKVLTEISSGLNVTETTEFKDCIDDDEKDMCNVLLTILRARRQVNLILALEGDAAQSVSNICHHLVLRARITTNEDTSKVLKVMGKLAQRCYALPETLFISGVTECTERAVFFGGYSDVFKGMFRGQAVALKRMRIFQSTDPLDPKAAKDRGNFCKEALVWQSLRHEYIVPFIGIDSEGFAPAFCIVSPWMKNGTVNMYLSKTPGAGRSYLVNRLIQEIAKGLAFLHSRGVIHGDLRGANILVNDEEHACLTDFGLTVLIDASSTDTTTSGNPGGCPRWTAPEDFEYHQRSPKSDIFAFACVCFELYTTQAPLPQVKDHAVMHSVMHDVRSPRPAHEIVSDHSWDLMKQCWVGDPAARPSIQQVIDQLERLPVSRILKSPAQMSNHYAGWVSAAVAPLLPFIDLDVNPHDHYVELVELGESPSGTTLAVARLATEGRDRLIVPRHVRQRDEQDLLARGATFVAIKIVPILPSDNPKLETLLREINLDLSYEHILGIDSLYLDPTADTLWLRMELMAMSLFRIILLLLIVSPVTDL